MLACAVKRDLMGGNLESWVRKFSRANLVPRVDQNIEHSTALFADEMLMALDQRIEMLRASEH
jgi:hypothetical protein